MPSLISSQQLTLADFENFSQQSAPESTAIIGKKFFSNGLKTIFSLSFQRALGGTSSIIADFKTALSQKYGKEIADFVFSPESERNALSQGLTNKTITTVLEKAEAINTSPLRDEFFSYQAAICSKQQAIKSHIQQLTGNSLISTQKKYIQIKNAWGDCADLFDTWYSNNSETTSASLTKFFQEKLETVDRISREIITETAEKILREEFHLSSKETKNLLGSVEKSLGTPLATEMLILLPKHTELTKISKALVEEVFKAIKEEERDQPSFLTDVPDTPEIKAFNEAINARIGENPRIKKFLDILNSIPESLEQTMTQLSPTLEAFAIRSNGGSPQSIFYMNEDGRICIDSSIDLERPYSSLEQQQAATRHFFSALEDFFGAESIAAIVSPEKQQQPLTIQNVHEIFDKIRNTFEQINEFLKANPLLITPEYIVELATHPEMALAAQKNHLQLGTEGNTWLRTAQEAGLCGVLLSGTKIGLALAGVCTPTLPCIALALGAATIDGYIMGHFIAGESGLSGNRQQEASIAGATSTLGSAAGLILQRSVQGSISAYIPEIVSSTVAEYGGSYAAMSLRSAVFAGERTAQQQLEDIEQTSLTPENMISIEARLVHFFRLQPHISRLITTIENIPADLGGSSSVTVANSPSTIAHES